MLIKSRSLSRIFQLVIVGGGVAIFVLFGILSGVSSQGDSSQTYPKGFRGGSCTLESDPLTIGYSGYFLPHDYEIPKDPMSTPFVPTLCGKIPSPGTLNITIDLLYPKAARDVPLALRLTRIGDNATEHELLSVPPQVYPSGVITQAFKLDAAGQYSLALDGRNAENPNLLIRVPIKVGTDWKDTFSNLLPSPKVHHPAGIHYSH